MRKEILFNDAGTAPAIPTLGAPVAATPKWRDSTIGAEARLRIKFPTGKTLIRLLPHITGAADTAYVHVFNVIKNDAFKAVASNGDLFSRAYQWLWQHDKDAIYHYEKNKTGLKLKPAQEGIAWAIWWDEENAAHLGLLQTAFSAGKNPGLLADIVTSAEAREKNPATGEEERVYEESVVHPVRGRLITVEKTVDKNVEARYGTSYSATISSKENAALEDLVQKIPAEEYAMIKPLEHVIKRATEEEQREMLKGYLGAPLFAKMGL